MITKTTKSTLVAVAACQLEMGLAPYQTLALEYGVRFDDLAYCSGVGLVYSIQKRRGNEIITYWGLTQKGLRTQVELTKAPVRACG